MSDKPTTAAGYQPHFSKLVKATCLYLATKLGDFLDDMVIVGGLVPTLLIPPQNLPAGAEPHVGTLDLDVGFQLAILDEERYRALSEQLRRAGFSPDLNDKGNPTRQRWKIERAEKVTVDFLMPPGARGLAGRLQPIESDFAALIVPGLQLAFQDRQQICLTGSTIFNENANRNVWVCGPGAYVVLKALAFRNRGENKDAYDLYYLLRNYGDGVTEVAQHLRPLLQDDDARRAIAILREDFGDPESLGPMRVAEFLASGPDEDIQADTTGFVTELLGLL